MNDNARQLLADKLRIQLRERILEKIDLTAKTIKDSHENITAEEFNQLKDIINQNNQQINELTIENEA